MPSQQPKDDKKWEKMIRRGMDGHIDFLQLAENHSFRPQRKGEPISFTI
jgi:hypothetical protein